MTKDPYRYFRVEARELLEGLTQGVIELEKGPATPDLVARLLRLAHTLKGAARVVKQPAIAELAHAVEDLLADHRGGSGGLAADRGGRLLAHLDRMGGLVAALQTPAAGASSTATPPGAVRTEETPESVRVDLREMDALLRSVADASVRLAALRQQVDAAGRPRGLTTAVERVEAAMAEVEEVAHRLRLLPAQTAFAALERAARDAAQTAGKVIDFEASGGEVRLDAQVLASIRDALIHVVRNAVAHGIESESQRLAAGKLPRGRIRLVVSRRGGRVSFVCSDDGRGVDVEAVRAAAAARGIASASRPMAHDEILTLLGGSGLTTTTEVTELAGRGVGMDVVRAAMVQLKGDLAIRSQPGQGTAIELQVPISIASLQGLMVEAGGTRAAIPLDSVRHALRVADGDIVRTAERETILHDGVVLPFLPLVRALRRDAGPARRRRSWPTLVVHAGGRAVAVAVDRLLGTAAVVMRTLPPLVEADPVVAGAFLDGEGNPRLVLDAAGLVDAGDRFRAAEPEPAAAPRPPVLVIDDSLTTRMLEQSILESAGYQVELATSAEEGLARARGRRHALFVVDVEMPGMDGFGFVAAVRADPALHDTPAILVTSRAAPADRKRGEEVGADAYIVKGEFDQSHLLDTIARLVR